MQKRSKKYEEIFNQGLENLKEGKLDDALGNFEKTLEINPKSVQALINISVIYISQGNFDKANEILLKAININPNYPETYLNLGVVYREIGKTEKAISIYKRVLKIKPDYAEVLGNLGACYRDEGNLEKALFYFKKAVKLNSTIADFLYNIGNIYGELGKNNLSLKYYHKAIDINPNFFNAYYNLGVNYQDSGKLDKAAEMYMNVLKINPFFEDDWGNLEITLRLMCRWDLLEKVKGNLDEVNARSIQVGRRPGEPPFFSITEYQDPKRALKIATAWSKDLETRLENIRPAFDIPRPNKNRKIKLGFISDGFRKFPTAQNLLGVLEKIDKKRFEVYLYSYGFDDESIYRKRAEKLATKFIDISKLNFINGAKQIHKDNIDILVDLKGYSRNNRVKIIALHPAPIVVSYLGFAGTMGAKFVDYIIADKEVIPEDHLSYYSEKIINLPDTYWPTDNSFNIPATRKQTYDIPKNKFVFSSFNQAYKITPEILEVWLNILRQVPDSVLVLWKDNAFALTNLLERIAVSGIDKKRIIFAETLPKGEHLSRLRDCVEIALDTTTVNGHTTTTDALWAGVPVITIRGSHFMSRVSASQLKAIGLPELITQNLKEYEKLAVKLATNKTKYKSLKTKLAKNIKSTPLFN